jgi:hypothetical protein
MKFQQAVMAIPSVRNYYKPGLQALTEADKNRIQCNDSRMLTGSICVDKALEITNPNSPRWDYGIGYRFANKETAIWVEVHPASSTSIKDMLDKLKWLKQWLSTQAHQLKALTKAKDCYYWVSTSDIAITKHSPQARGLAMVGLIGPKRVLYIPPERSGC